MPRSSRQLASFFRSEGTETHFRKDEVYSPQGLCSRFCGLVVAGAFRYVHTGGGGDRHVVGYAFASEFTGDYISMRNGTASSVTIEAMCDCRVLQVTGGRLESFYRTDAAHERLGRRMAERLLAEVYERLLQACAVTPQRRYEELLRRCPDLFHYVPLQELASYLGVRPETLSRIRRRVR